MTPSRHYVDTSLTIIRLDFVSEAMAHAGDFERSIADALADIVPRGKESYLARRQVAAWQAKQLLPDDADLDELTALCMALRRVQPEKRIQLSQLGPLLKKVRRTVSVKQRFYIVPKGNIKNLADMLPYIIDRSRLKDLPVGINLDSVYFVDCCVPREKLGLGAICQKKS